MESKVQSRYTSYCFRCGFTVHNGEWCYYNDSASPSKVRHVDCTVAMSDKTKRVQNKRFVEFFGKANKNKLVEKSNEVAGRCDLCEEVVLEKQALRNKKHNKNMLYHAGCWNTRKKGNPVETVVSGENSAQNQEDFEPKTLLPSGFYEEDIEQIMRNFGRLS